MSILRSSQAQQPPASRATVSAAAPAAHGLRSGTSARKVRRPRILVVTPELNGSRFLGRNGQLAPMAKAGGLADVSTLLVDALADSGVDVRVTMPHFRNLFSWPETPRSRRLHLCPDREFFYRRHVYEGCQQSNRRAALAFQRDVIEHVLPRVKPDIVHCHDWMTALVPAAARSMGIKSVFTIHNLHDELATMAEIEDRGIDAERFWQHLQFERYPQSYSESRSHNPVRLMPSAVHAADHVNTVSPSFLRELIEGRHPAGWPMADALRAKFEHGQASGIINAPDPGCSPETDPYLPERYTATSHRRGKAVNKDHLQRELGLEQDPEAPILFWPSRLDPSQKGCQLLADILYRVVSDYWALGLQVVFVADGPFQRHFDEIAGFHGLRHRIAVHGFNEALSRRAYAASDFILMPSAYEPCGLSQMVALKYGSLPIVHHTGGLRDTVRPLEPDAHRGNGFAFEHHDSTGLRWAIDQAMRFQILPAAKRAAQIKRIMRESAQQFNPATTVDAYLEIYRRLAETGPALGR
jgi:starch synthase